MKILVIGGTGTMGAPLVELLCKNNDVHVVCRKKTEVKPNVRYYYGDANDISFLKSILTVRYDAIVDFCWCDSKQFAAKYCNLLDSTDQYVCLSSAAVVAEGDIPQNEDAPRFLEIDPPSPNDKSYYLYHYEKARIEDILIHSGKKNWTVIRPHITYNDNHIIWGEFLEDKLLLRAVIGKKVIAPKDMIIKYSSMTHGKDVAQMISNLLGNENALGEIFNVSNPKGMTWGQMLEIIKEILKGHGIILKVQYIENCRPLQIAFPSLSSRYTYDRLIDRVFTNDKYVRISGKPIIFTSYEEGMKQSIESWFNKQHGDYRVDDGHAYAALDRLSHEWTSLSYFSSFKEKVHYVVYRIPCLIYPYDVIMKSLKLLKNLLWIKK